MPVDISATDNGTIRITYSNEDGGQASAELINISKTDVQETANAIVDAHDLKSKAKMGGER